ncbi:T9SS type A sorting domain-containing protein [Bacteroidota bacterium]
MEVSTYWPASFMGAYAGYSLHEVEIYINDAPVNSTLKVYGPGTASAPGALLYEQAFTAVANSWQMIPLTTTVPLDGNDIWIGYEVTNNAGTYSAGCDDGPAIAGYGDMIAAPAAGLPWQPMSGVGLNFNWNIHSRVEAGGGSGSWLTLDYYSGTVPPGGGLDNIPTNFDAAGTTAGDFFTADIIFTSDPDVGTITIPCSMTIVGTPLSPPTDLVVTVIDDVAGIVGLEWLWTADAFQYFLIKRDGVTVGTTTNTTFTDYLPGFGPFCYTVQAVYDEGSTSPAGPECIEWYIPDFCWDPFNPENYQWPEVDASVALEIENCGQGTLAFTFPEYAVTDLLNDPNFVHNKVGDPWAGQEFDIKKGEDDPRDGLGYPVNRGAGGPDAFGYTWIDSDEAGGPSYNWEDISGTGTLVAKPYTDDGITGPFPIGFDFPFYDEVKTQFWIASNGAITFSNPYGTYFSLTNQPIPTGNYTDLISWFWDDLDPRGALTNIYYQSFADRLVIQFDTYYEYFNANGRYTNTEVILYTNGKILINYDFFSAGFDMASETIGIQSSDDAVGLQVAYNTTYAHDGLALLIMPPTPHFVVDVEPAFGVLAEGQSMDLTLTYSSVGFEPGTYNEEIEALTNAPAPMDQVFINNTMHVYYPGELVGTVTDCNTGLGLPGVTVTAGIWQDVTATDGSYAFYLDAGTYMVEFDKVGYQGQTVMNVIVPENVQTVVDASLCEVPYPPAWVTADPNMLDTECDVDWALPLGPYEILYDDGSADELVLWSTAGGENAVKFTPLGYPANIVGGRVYIGDGNFPAGNWFGSQFSIVVYDDDGTNGMPGTVLDSIPVTVGNYGWITFWGGVGSIPDGDFYISMLQTQYAPAAPLGVDYTMPTVYRSYSRYGINDWALSVYQDFMIRAFVEGPTVTDGIANGTEILKPSYMNKGDLGTVILSESNKYPVIAPGVVGGGEIAIIDNVTNTGNRDLEHYEVARVSNFDPNVGPQVGTLTTIANNVTVETYLDSDWGGLAPGWYAYAVRAYYTNGDISPWTYSNTVAHGLDWEVTFEVVICDGSDPDGVDIEMVGLDYPFNVYSETTDITGIVVFDSVIQGPYIISAYKLGYENIEFNDVIVADVTYPLTMCDNRFPPTGLWVDPFTSWAYWNYPVAPTIIEEDFDGAFPPDEWTKTSNGVGWFATTNGSSGFWPIPPWTSQYACANDDLNNDDGSMDYLITPPLTLSNGYMLYFDSFFDGAWGESAYVEYSFDEGATWTELVELAPNAAWTNITVDLAPIIGMGSPVWIGFHADDNGLWASGWAIDNVSITDGNPPQPDPTPIDFHVFLDGAFVDVADTNFYQYVYLTYGVNYEAAVAARYCCGLSDKAYYYFTSEFLLPPLNLDGETYDDAVHIWWNPPIEPITDALTESNSVFSPNYVGVNEVAEVGGVANGTPVGTKPLSSSRALLFDNGPLVNSPGTGAGGADESVLQSTSLGMNTIGGGCQQPLAYSMADDFVVDGNWTITEIILFGYQTGSGPPSTITGGYVQIWDGDPTAGGSVIWGDLTTNIMIDTYWSDIYRVTETTMGATNRPVMEVVCGTAGLVLAPGTYWLEFSLAGSGASGPWTPPVTINGETTTGNAMQNLAGVYGAWTDVGQQGNVFLINGTAGGGGGGSVPDNLLGYNVYRDMGTIAYVPYNDEDTSHYYDLDLDPATYQYDVSALYDLTPYGFPGDTGESPLEGPIYITVQFGHPLPFNEMWNSGSFDVNFWQHEGNWRINGQIGDPEPSAEFTWDPITAPYRQALTSYPIDGVNIVDPFVDGQIWFDYTVRLDDRNTTGDEFLKVEVGVDGNWETIASYDNSAGSFDWTNYHHNISSLAFGEIFKIRFFAEGMNSNDLQAWFVDNIHVYRVCAGPRNLVATPAQTFDDCGEVYLNWNSPASGGGGGGGTGEWIHWDDGAYAGSLGLTNGGSFNIMSHWDAADLTQYDGGSLTKVAFFAADEATVGSTTTYAIQVYQGANGSATLVHEELATYSFDTYNEVTLSTPVLLDVTQELWFGVLTTHDAGFFPACRDAGPAVVGYGDMISTAGNNSWVSVGTLLAYDYNWNIQGFIETGTDQFVALKPVSSSMISNNTSTDLSDKVAVNPVTTGNRDMLGYRIYRDGAEIAFTADTFYTDVVNADGIYIYDVVAVYDDCESDTAATDDAIVDCGVGIEELLNGGIAVYPNPAKDVLNIESAKEITFVTILNNVGQVVYNNKVVNDNVITINTSAYEAGVYMVKIETADEVLVKKVLIAQ